MNPIETVTKTTYLHRVDSSSSPRVIIVRQSSFKAKPTTPIKILNTEQDPQQLSTIATSVSMPEKHRKSFFK
jgi:hypothetical protein